MPKRSLRRSADLPVSIQLIERKIYLIHGQKVMLDRDLAELYQVKPIALRQQVKPANTWFASRKTSCFS